VNRHSSERAGPDVRSTPRFSSCSKRRGGERATAQRQLPEWASTLAGIGVQLVTLWQSTAQVDAIYGRPAAKPTRS